MSPPPPPTQASKQGPFPHSMQTRAFPAFDFCFFFTPRFFFLCLPCRLVSEVQKRGKTSKHRKPTTNFSLVSRHSHSVSPFQLFPEVFLSDLSQRNVFRENNISEKKNFPLFSEKKVQFFLRGRPYVTFFSFFVT